MREIIHGVMILFGVGMAWIGGFFTALGMVVSGGIKIQRRTENGPRN